MALIFVASDMPHEPGKVGINIIFDGGSFLVRPNLKEARDLLHELTTAIALAEKLVAPAEAAA